jgi:hypothetical protein
MREKEVTISSFRTTLCLSLCVCVCVCVCVCTCMHVFQAREHKRMLRDSTESTGDLSCEGQDCERVSGCSGKDVGSGLRF